MKTLDAIMKLSLLQLISEGPKKLSFISVLILGSNEALASCRHDYTQFSQLYRLL